jgi:hypothetical protein
MTLAVITGRVIWIRRAWGGSTIDDAEPEMAIAAIEVDFPQSR